MLLFDFGQPETNIKTMSRTVCVRQYVTCTRDIDRMPSMMRYSAHRIIDCDTWTWIKHRHKEVLTGLTEEEKMDLTWPLLSAKDFATYLRE